MKQLIKSAILKSEEKNSPKIVKMKNLTCESLAYSGLLSAKAYFFSKKKLLDYFSSGDKKIFLRDPSIGPSIAIDKHFFLEAVKKGYAIRSRGDPYFLELKELEVKGKYVIYRLIIN